jgi:hypothetical protein
MKYFKKAVFLLGICILTAYSANCQPCPPGADGLPDCSGGDPSAPFDGGASIIIAVGAGIAAKKAYDKRKATQQDKI